MTQLRWASTAIVPPFRHPRLLTVEAFGPPMRPRMLPVAIAVVLTLAGSAAALPADKHVELEADDGDSCLSDQKADCFRVTNGSLEGLEQGMRIHLKLENVGSAPHNAYVTQSSNADENHVDTPADAAINSTETIDPEGNTSMVFQIPDDAGGLYIWCDVGNHETAGMWLNASVEEASDGEGNESEQDPDEGDNGTDGAGGDDGDSAIPSPGPVATLVAGVLALAIRRKAKP